MSRRLGCLTGAGLISAAITLLLSLGIILAFGGAWFSPGPLNAQPGAATLGGVTSHAATGGRCDTCHPAPWAAATMSDRCLVCHTAVADQLADPTSLHGALKGHGTEMACRTCHPEHRGPTAGLTVLDPKAFPHDAVGYTLAGHTTRANGQPFACADCHTEKLTSFDVAVCADCHHQADAAYLQQHMADFGATCLGCHDGADRYSRRRFDHDRLAFPLTGRHVGMACAGCHAGARTVADLQAAPQTCVGCHKDPAYHLGAFGTACADCHTADGWRPARYNRPHTFPLDHGKSGVSSCKTCHPDRLQAYTCYGCHEHTPAKIESKHLEEGIRDFADCMKCHPTGREDGEDEEDD